MIHEFKAQITEASEGRFTARIAPFGVSVAYGRSTVEFAAGSIHVPTTTIPLTVDHGLDVLDRIGIMERSVETPDGLYADFTFADTAKAKDVRELLLAGAVTDVSVGIELAEDFKGGVMDGVLDHVSVVSAGRFPSAEVLSVHDDKEANVPEVEEMAPAPVVAEFDDTEIKAGLVELSQRIDEIPTPAKTAEFTGMEVFEAALMKRAGGKIANHALADVIGDLGAADASGLAPNTYWAAGLQHKVDRRRPLFATGGAAPFPATGYNLDLPKVTQEVLVAPRGAEKGEANSRALQVVAQSFPIQWFDGAVDVAYEIISQSDPSVLSVIASSMLTQYATAVELDASTLIEASATATGGLLNTANYAGLVGDIITTSDLIEDATGAPGDILGVTSAQWIEILSLMDGGDRRQFAMINPQNADGSGSLTTRGIDVGGVFIYRAPALVAAVQYNSESYKKGEKTPMQVQAENVELMGRDVGVLGATVNVFWPEGIYGYTL